MCSHINMQTHADSHPDRNPNMWPSDLRVNGCLRSCQGLYLNGLWC